MTAVLRVRPETTHHVALQMSYDQAETAAAFWVDCACGWSSAAHGTVTPARREADVHTLDVLTAAVA